MASIEVDVLTVDELYPALTEHHGSASPRFEVGPPPSEPGVYVWDSQGSVLYIGSAVSLKIRIDKYKKWIGGYLPDDEWEVSVVHMLKKYHGAVRWLATADRAEALVLERRLIEWHRACVGIAPVVTGWNAKADSPRATAEEWARTLWRKLRLSQLSKDDVNVTRNERMETLRSAVDAVCRGHGCSLDASEIFAVMAVESSLKINEAHIAAHAISDNSHSDDRSEGGTAG